MVNRLVSVGDDFTLPPAVKVADPNLPERLGAAQVAAAQKWDPKRFLYASPTALQKWRAALAKARGPGAARLNICGDSVTQNNAASDTASPKYLNSYTWHLRALLAKDYGNAGTGVVFPIDSSLPDDSRWIISEAWAAPAYGPFEKTARGSFAAGPEIFFTADCDSFTVYYFGNTNYGTFDMSVDGGAVTSHSAIHGSAGVYSTTISAGAKGAHTLKILNTSGVVFILGIEGAVGSSGVRVTKVGKGGATSADLIGDAVNEFGSLKTTWAAPYAPDLSVLFFGFNDHFAGTTIAAYKANMSTLITEAKKSGDVLLIAPYNTANNGGVSFAPTTAALYELADEKDCAVLDLNRRWPADGFASMQQGLIATDGLHLDDVGTWEVANALHAAIR